MSDSTPHEPTQDKLAAVRLSIQQWIDRVTAFPEVVGLIVVSSGSFRSQRKTFDDFSDVDIAIVIDGPDRDIKPYRSARDYISAIQSELPPWLPNFEFEAPIQG